MFLQRYSFLYYFLFLSLLLYDFLCLDVPLRAFFDKKINYFV